MLHVINGDCTADKLKQTGIPGQWLVWREIFMEGPISADLYEDACLDKRADYLARVMGIPRDVYAGNVLKQVHTLHDFPTHEEVVFWFEYDLFDQVNLIYLLDWFAGQVPGRTRLSLICPREFPGIADFRGLGELTPAQLGSLFGTRAALSEEHLALGSRAWHAYASPHPAAIEALLETDTSPLPCLREALLCHLERFPALRNGLGRIENEVLALVAAGVDTFVPLFQEVGKRGRCYGFGDLQLWFYLDRMRQGEYPLLRIAGPGELPRYSAGPLPDPGQWRLAITEGGRAVLAGSADWVRENGIDLWLGGVHLVGKGGLWRWDAGSRKLVFG